MRELASRFRIQVCAALLLASPWPRPALADGDVPTRFSNRGSIANTRHNMTQRQPGGGGPDGAAMDAHRNDYGEVCVYCHTPHAANAGIALPLWNRTIKATSYTTYADLGTNTLTQAVVQPGASSLACLSCHDGQVAVDSIINMPGSGGVNPAQAGMQNNGFLNAWINPRGPRALEHLGLDPMPQEGCLSCHSRGAGSKGQGAADFSVFVIGTDLRNDHPVGVAYPLNIDFRSPTGRLPGVIWFDTDGNGRPGSAEVRLYDTSGGAMVECASCHDPHGVPIGGTGSPFIASFLRVRNTFSDLCLTCHTK